MRNAAAAAVLGVLCLVLVGLIFLPTKGLLRGSPDVRPVALNYVVEQVLEARAANQIAVLYLWASWCPACQDSLPNLNRVVRRWEGKDVRFIVVSVDQDLEALEQMLEITGASFEPLCVPAAPKEKLLEAMAGLGAEYPSRIPYGAVFDREGKLYRQWTGWRGMDAWEGAIEELL